jgi:hypothetical protein
MDDEFFKQQARQVRELAGKADPFIKKRLLDLADRDRATLSVDRDVTSQPAIRFGRF